MDVYKGSMANTGMTKGDMERLFIAMEEFGYGVFDNVDESEYDDPKVAQAFNNMVDLSCERNNRYLARINDAQSRIGDTSCLKSMFEEINSQQGLIQSLQEFQDETQLDNRPLEKINEEFLALSLQIANAFGPCLKEIDKSAILLENVIDVLPDSGIKAELIGDIENAKQTIIDSADRMESIERRMQDMSEDAKMLFDTIDKRSKLDESFFSGVGALTESYKKLTAECLETGRHLYRISRDIDNARNDMFRHNSRPTLHDRLRVYEIDHVTLAWRLYNNIVEFESLRLTQVNNTTGCKLGIWIENMTDPTLLEALQYQRLVKAHENLHIKAVECFEAKQNYDNEKALEIFEELMVVLKEFQDAMQGLHDFLRTLGDNEETDVWKFRG